MFCSRALEHTHLADKKKTLLQKNYLPYQWLNFHSGFIHSCHSTSIQFESKTHRQQAELPMRRYSKTGSIPIPEYSLTSFFLLNRCLGFSHHNPFSKCHRTNPTIKNHTIKDLCAKTRPTDATQNQTGHYLRL